MSPSEDERQSFTVLPLPQFKLADDELFFLISRRPHARLSPFEAQVWNALEPGPSVGELHERFSEKVDDVLHRFKELGVCELTRSTCVTGRRRILVVEPHSDDAVLSVGGTMWEHRHESEFVVATVASRSNFTSYYTLGRDYFDVDAISSLRAAEGELFVRVLGGQYRALGRSDAPLRYHGGDWSLEWYRQHVRHVSVFMFRHASEEELSDWVDAVHDLIHTESPDEIWIPLGLAHRDHQLTRNACLRALSRTGSPLGHPPVRFYEDVPYVTRYPEEAASVVAALERAGIEMTREVMPIASSFEQKLHLVSLYGSQFKPEAMRADIVAAARQAGEPRDMAEALWHVNRLPGAVEPLALYVDQRGLSQARERLGPWIRRHRKAPRIRLLLSRPPGGWADDADFLLRAFPEAEFDVYASTSAVAELSGSDFLRVHLHPIGAGAVNRARLGLRLLASAPVPTLFVAGRSRFLESSWQSFLWLGGDTAAVPTMEHVMIVVREMTPSAHAREPPR